MIESSGMQIVNMGEDGNCLFRSISHQIYGTEEYHDILRAKCVEYLEAETTYYKDFIPGGGDAFERYCNRMRRNGVWGDNLEIQAFFEIYQRPIEIYAYSDKPMKTFSNDPKSSSSSNNNTDDKNNSTNDTTTSNTDTTASTTSSAVAIDTNPANAAATAPTSSVSFTITFTSFAYKLLACNKSVYPCTDFLIANSKAF